MTIKNTFRRGFTLIELMIVIVILGILMGTILPRLTGAQARARDTARKADLSNISQALELYYSDNGSYPVAKTGLCLDSTDKIDSSAGANVTVTATLGSYMKGKGVPAAASKNQETLKCTKANSSAGQYYYQSLEAKGVSSASYVLVSSVEAWQMGNYKASTTSNIMIGSATGSSGEEKADNVSTVKFTEKTADKDMNYFYIITP